MFVLKSETRSESSRLENKCYLLKSRTSYNATTRISYDRRN